MKLAMPAALAVALALAACGSDAPSLDLDGRTFLSTAITDGGADRPLVDGTRLRIGFRDGQVAAHAGCNHLAAGYRVDGGRLETDAMSTTDIGCDQALHAQDTLIAEFLGSRPALRLADGELTLESGGVVMVLTDREIADPDRSLTGTTWTVVSLIEGDTVSSVPGDVAATLRIGDDGSLEVSTGCNRGGGSVEVADETLRFSALTLTEMACDGNADAMERAVLAVLGAGNVAYAVEADMLTLDAGGIGLQLEGG